ncbi:MAG TPA: hypothetical protein VN088_20285 [Nocardioides sp.]|nr:hypothetical protein [Nocardioides sp.]
MAPPPASHSHAWQLAEVEYADNGSVRRLECACGQVDYRPDF